MRRWQPWVWGAATLLGLAGIGYLLTFLDTFGGVLLITAPFGAYAVWRGIVDDRAKALGKAAFARGYAQSRTLTEENPRLFQARHMRLRLPGRVETALTGTLPHTDRAGALLFVCSKTAKTRTDYDVVVLEDASGLELPAGEKDLKLVRHEGTTAVYAKSKGETKRTAADLDKLLERVGALAGAPR